MSTFFPYQVESHINLPPSIYRADVKHAACFNATDAPPNYPAASSQSAIIASETFTDWEPASETTTYSTPAPNPTPSTLVTMVSSKITTLSLEDIIDAIPDIISYLDIDIEKTIDWSDVLGQTTWVREEVADQITLLPELVDETTMTPEEILDQTTWLSDPVDTETTSKTKTLTKHLETASKVLTPGVPVWTEFAWPVTASMAWTKPTTEAVKPTRQ